MHSTIVAHNTIRRYMCVGEECEQYTHTLTYALYEGRRIHSCVDPILNDIDGGCAIHGRGCMGHI
jgi:hypothetical protein